MKAGGRRREGGIGEEYELEVVGGEGGGEGEEERENQVMEG